MHKCLRKISRKTAWLSGLAAAVLFVAGVFMNDNNLVIRYIWQGSALTGLLAFGVETWLRRLDEKETSPRALSKKQIEIIRSAVGPFAGQKFMPVYGSGQISEGKFAAIIGRVLVGCGWTGRGGQAGCFNTFAYETAEGFDPGIRIDLPLNQGTEKQTIEAAISLFHALEKCGFLMVKGGIEPYPEICGISPWGPTVIEIWIGPKSNKS